MAELYFQAKRRTDVEMPVTKLGVVARELQVGRVALVEVDVEDGFMSATIGLHQILAVLHGLRISLAVLRLMGVARLRAMETISQVARTG